MVLNELTEQDLLDSLVSLGGQTALAYFDLPKLLRIEATVVLLSLQEDAPYLRDIASIVRARGFLPDKEVTELRGQPFPRFNFQTDTFAFPGPVRAEDPEGFERRYLMVPRPFFDSLLKNFRTQNKVATLFGRDVYEISGDFVSMSLDKEGLPDVKVILPRDEVESNPSKYRVFDGTQTFETISGMFPHLEELGGCLAVADTSKSRFAIFNLDEGQFWHVSLTLAEILDYANLLNRS